MKLGIIGAGFVGRSVATLAIACGHQVMIANSRGPQTLFSLRVRLGCETGTAVEAAAFGEIALIAVPLSAIGDLPAQELSGKVVLDAVNYYPQRDGHVAELDAGQIGTSELLARILPTSRIIKAFNAIPMPQLESDGRPAGDPARRALPLAGDDAEGKSIAANLYHSFGFDPVDAGALKEGWRFERDRPSYCKALDRTGLINALAQASRT